MAGARKLACVFMAMVLLFSMGLGGFSATAASAAPKGSALAKNGRLAVKGGQVVNADGKAFVIKGVSTHGLSWYPQYVTRAGFKTLRDDFGVNTIRLALYTAEYNGYCTGDAANKKALKKQIDKGVRYATDLGMYVIIDWHILSDGNPKTYQKDSIKFFKQMAQKYKGHKNVIYEICNEPNGDGGSWKNIKSYAKKVIKAIRKIDKRNLIIVGTPTWSQDVDTAAADRITGYKNIAYAFHFYAGTHKAGLRKKLKSVLEAGLPVVVTEFGITDASGSGGVNKSQGNKWISLLNRYAVGRVCWNLSNKDESSALLKASCTKLSGWKAADLSPQGKWLLKKYTGKSAAGSTKDEGGAQKAKVTAKATLTSSWQQGEETCYLYTVKMKNKGKKATSGWTVKLKFSKKVRLSSGWNGRYTLTDGGKTLKVKPESYNKKIGKGKGAEFSFIISAKGGAKLSATSATCK